ncbi:uncharacterized protein B0H18DRAFT_143822 [Fomitopsis serialis]|uniref:uncharacterized protein n=1 Tax=Fomitopsis serialis TaxID=139415 RepID=UPI00200744B4|nr:uncharacterized protein B0H18DRAFT_143822 [Neoantrodia serialis]KAH9930234.1 hypothetical protein B0H18DRAFT_143822 [Neoantrodia serialis]
MKPLLGLGLPAELFPPGMQGTLTPLRTPLPPIIERDWAPPPRALSPESDDTDEDVYSPMEVALARIQVSYFPDAEEPDNIDVATGSAPPPAARVRTQPPSPVPPMSIAAAVALARRPGLQRMPTYASPRPLTVARFVPEPCSALTGEYELGLRFSFAFGLLLSPRAPRSTTPQAAVFPPIFASGQPEPAYRLDDSPFTPGVQAFNQGDPVADPLELLLRDFPITPGPRRLAPPMFDSSEDPVVSPSELELRDFPLTPGAPVDRFAEVSFDGRGSDENEQVDRPASPLGLAEYVFGVYL